MLVVSRRVRCGLAWSWWRQNDPRGGWSGCGHGRMLARRGPGVGWRWRKLRCRWIVTFAEEIDASTRRLLAFGSLDPSAVDVESDAVVARIVVIASDSTMMTGITGTEHLFRLVLGIVIVFDGRSGGAGILPIAFRVVFGHGCVSAHSLCHRDGSDAAC